MSKKYDFDEPEFITVGALDIEALSLRMDAAITELGYVVTRIYGGDYTKWAENIQHVGTVQLDLLEQLKLGRHVDAGTIDFQERTFGRDEYRDIVYGRPGKNIDFFYAEEGLREIQRAFRGAHEIWMNHPTFDAGRTNTLAERMGIYGGLWHYGSEMDIHSIKYKLGLEVDGEDPNAHRGLNDCYYNLNILAELAKTHVCQWQRGHGYVWTRKMIEVYDGPVGIVRKLTPGAEVALAQLPTKPLVSKRHSPESYAKGWATRRSNAAYKTHVKANSDQLFKKFVPTAGINSQGTVSIKEKRKSLERKLSGKGSA